MESSSKRRFAVEFWGVPFAVEWATPEFDEDMSRLLLSNWIHQPGLKPEAIFRVTTDETGEPILETPADLPIRASKPNIVDSLERSLQLYLGSKTRDAVFVHAGVVGWKGGALVVPGRSFAGKSTLTLAFLQAGASYYSDEYAIIDAQGLVHPFPRRLSMRLEGGQTERIHPSARGWPVGREPLPLKGVLSGSYEKGATWEAKPISRGEGVLKLLSNTVSAQAAPELALKFLGRAVESAACYDSPRGAAEETVLLMVAELGKIDSQ